MTKLAVLMMLHGKPRGFWRVIDKLQDENITFFVHVDKKNLEASFREAVDGIPRVYFVPAETRVAVNWGGRTQVDAMIQLMQTASSLDGFDRYLFLTGNCYPICTPQQLLAHLSTITSELVRIDRILTARNDNKIRGLSLHDVPWLNHRNLSGWRAWLAKQVLRVCRLVRIGSLPSDLTVVHGSSSMCLTDAAVNRILDFHSSDRRFYSSLWHSFSSDEFYFHTILYNSGFSFMHDFTDCPKPMSRVYGLHYVDWGAEVRSPPKIIGPEDIQRIVAEKQALFVRKVDLEDRELLLTLDQIPSLRSLPNG